MRHKSQCIRMQTKKKLREDLLEFRGWLFGGLQRLELNQEHMKMANISKEVRLELGSTVSARIIRWT